MNSNIGLDRWRRRSRIGLSVFYGFAGVLHIAWPGPFLTITPQWVPLPQDVILTTGLCEIAGAVGLWSRHWRKAAGIGLALYAVCVYPANIKHAIDGLSAADANILRWLYHVPRLLLQPILVWLPLFAVGLVTWPIGRSRAGSDAAPSTAELSTTAKALADEHKETTIMEDTPSLKLAKEYLRLGGTRKSKIDDNITNTRKWEGEPEEAAMFWKENIEVLDEDERKQVEDFLPSINDL